MKNPKDVNSQRIDTTESIWAVTLLYYFTDV